MKAHWIVNQSTLLLTEAEDSLPESIKYKLMYERQFIHENNLNYQVGFTEVSKFSLNQITGARKLNFNASEAIRRRLNKIAAASLISRDSLNKIYGLVSLSHFDSRDLKILPPIRMQKCGNCWAYAAICNLECNYIRSHPEINPQSFDLSEQQMEDCAGAGDCTGGYFTTVLDYLKSSKSLVLSEEQYPDVGKLNNGCPDLSYLINIKAINWGIVDSSNDPNRISSIKSIKMAIVQYGSVSVYILATPSMQDYKDTLNTGIVFKELPSETNPDNIQINHAINIIGWDNDKKAWLVRNSWGDSWGYKGYGWVAWDANNIGFSAAWCKSN